jgi:hypothetical protein
MKTNTIKGSTMRSWRGLALAMTMGACSGAGAGAGGGGDQGGAPVFNAVDPSQVCPVGYVGWDFATGTNFEDVPKDVRIQSATCLTGLTPTDIKAAAKTACDGKRTCEVPSSCAGPVTITWTCGDDLTTFSNQQAAGTGASQIACILKTADGGAPALASPKGKACVPKVCPAAQRRDANMQCVADVDKPTINPGDFQDIAMVPTYNVYPGSGFSANTDYNFTLTRAFAVDSNKTPLQSFGGSQATIWLVDRFERLKADGSTDPKDFVEGFRCEATKMALTNPVALNYLDAYGRLVPNSLQAIERRQTQLSKECTDPRVSANTTADAAIRVGMRQADFEAKYRMAGVYAHVSLDMEGVTIPSADGTGVTSCAVNPPGFFYHPEESYVDRIAYYKQRELAPEKTVVKKVLDSAVGEPTRIEAGVLNAAVRDPEMLARQFGDDLPTLTADVTWYVAGDNPKNPYSPQASYGDYQNLRQRNLRATLYFQRRKNPSGLTSARPLEVIPISSVPLPLEALNPSGTTTPMKFKVPKKIKDAMFTSYDGWADYDYVQAQVCLEADGIDPTVKGGGELPWTRVGASLYGAGLGSSCVLTTVIHVTRDRSRRPLQATSTSGDISFTKDTGTGDGSSSSTTNNDTDRSCTAGVCTTVRNTGLTTGGVLRKLLFNVVTEVITKDTDQSSSIKATTSAEALGFQVVDVDDGEQEMDFPDRASTPKDGISIEVSPNWDLLIDKLRKVTGKSPVEWEKGKYAGVMGLGVGLGYKIPLQIGPIPGLVTISVSAGLSISLQVGVKYRPDSPDDAYPCITSDVANGRCYGVVGASAPMTQLEAQGTCGSKGGRLAEVHSLDELQSLRGYMSGAGAGDRFWLGAQLAYDYYVYDCAQNWNAAKCQQWVNTKFRWLSNDAELASQTGLGPTTLSGAAVGVLTADAGLTQLAPAMGGVFFDNAAGTISAASTDQKLPAVCEFDPATAASYLDFSTGVHLGGGAGLGLSFCTPSDEFGVCIEGHLNFIDIGVTPEVGVTSFILFRKDATTGKNALWGLRGNTYSDAPVDVTVLSGSVDAVVNFFIGSATWTIVSYPGLSLYNTKLYEKNYPFAENY